MKEEESEWTKRKQDQKSEEQVGGEGEAGGKGGKIEDGGIWRENEEEEDGHVERRGREGAKERRKYVEKLWV